MYVYNPFGTAPEDFDRETAGSRIGRRIRAIRTEDELSQGELGEKVGLNANRIQQYENGARNPKFDLCKQIAEALEVETSALLDPQVASYIGAMYAFFEMETLYDLRLKEVDGQMCICFGESQNDINVSTMNKNLKAWHDRRKKMEDDILNAESEDEKKNIIHEYHMWEWNFPHSTEEKPMSKSERAAKERAAHELEKIMLESKGMDQN
jgi:transcriptional regulator with XRE-family HTH domain